MYVPPRLKGLSIQMQTMLSNLAFSGLDKHAVGGTIELLYVAG